MYLSSRGGITCGRKNPGSALFPYYTDDKIHDASSTTVSKNVVLVEGKETCYLWEPFHMDPPCVYRVTRNLYRNRTGNKLIFEEINHSLGLQFQYAWTISDRYGFIRQWNHPVYEKHKDLSEKGLHGSARTENCCLMPGTRC